MPLEPGHSVDSAALAIALRDQHGRERRLADFREHNVVLYFYPKDDTPGCTVEGREFRHLREQFAALDCSIIGASTDSVESHRAFAEKYGLPFVLLADERGELAQSFGVLENGLAKRSTFVLDRELRLQRAFYEVQPRGHALEVLEFVRKVFQSQGMLGG